MTTRRRLAALLLLAACRRTPSPPSTAPASPASTSPAPPASAAFPAPAGTGAAATPSAFTPSTLPRIDTHVHVTPGGMAQALDMLGAQHIVHFVNLSGSSPGRGLEEQLGVAAQTGGRVSVFTMPDFRECDRPGYGERMARKIQQAHDMGAVGVKITKGLGLGYPGPDGRLLAVDDPGLDPVFEMAGRLGMPVAIHTGDPKAFWQPPTMANERYDELSVHPGWSFYGQGFPSWEELYAQFERRVARHAKTTFIGVHFGNDPEDPDRVARMLDAHPNLYIDTAARIPEIGRHDPAKMRAFFIKYQDRILFGTDAGFGEEPSDLMLGSTGAEPPTAAEVRRFWDATWRYFETNDRGMIHPTPIQGRWTIDAIGLPEDVLRKVYAGNAVRLLKLDPRRIDPTAH